MIPNDVEKQTNKKPIHTSMVLPCIQELFSRMFLEQKFYKTEMSPSCERAHLFVPNTVLFLCEENGRWLCWQPLIKDGDFPTKTMCVAHTVDSLWKKHSDTRERRCHRWIKARLAPKHTQSQVLIVSHLSLENHEVGWANKPFVSDTPSILSFSFADSVTGWLFAGETVNFD